MEQREPVFGLWLELPVPPSELPLISCVLFSLFLFLFSTPSIFSSVLSSLRLSLYFLSRIFLRFLYLSRYPPPLPFLLRSSSTWLKWRLSALLEAAEEARSFRSVSSHTYSSLHSLGSSPDRSLTSSPISSSIFSFSPEADLTFSLEHSPL